MRTSLHAKRPRRRTTADDGSIPVAAPKHSDKPDRSATKIARDTFYSFDNFGEGPAVVANREFVISLISSWMLVIISSSGLSTWLISDLTSAYSSAAFTFSLGAPAPRDPHAQNQSKNDGSNYDARTKVPTHTYSNKRTTVQVRVPAPWIRHTQIKRTTTDKGSNSDGRTTRPHTRRAS